MLCKIYRKVGCADCGNNFSNTLESKRDFMKNKPHKLWVLFLTTLYISAFLHLAAALSSSLL